LIDAEKQLRTKKDLEKALAGARKKPPETAAEAVGIRGQTG